MTRIAAPSQVLWIPEEFAPVGEARAQAALLDRVRLPLSVVQGGDGRLALGEGGRLVDAALTPPQSTAQAYPLLAQLPAMYPEWLGDSAFTRQHGVRYAYIAGEMARGIASADMVIAMARAGLFGFFGSAGLSAERVEQDVRRILEAVGPQAAWGVNLIHSPYEKGLEDALVDLYLRLGVTRISASAFTGLVPAVVRFVAKGLYQAEDGRIARRHHLFAKISHPSVATPFLKAPPAAMLQTLVAEGRLTAQEADLAAQVPVADHLTVEGDSGGHTDSRPLVSLFPAIANTRDRIAQDFAPAAGVLLGAAGGLGTPEALAAAFAMGAAYVVTGSVNQSAVEAGISAEARQMLGAAQIDDVALAPAADMFEMGAKVQVLRRGTMFAGRATRLRALYMAQGGLEDLPQADRAALEKDVFRRPLEEVWADTRAFFAKHDPAEVSRAEADPKHRMALVFRWYMGLSSRWPIEGTEDRRADYQIWCGPAQGAFNAWVAGTPLAEVAHRNVAGIADVLMQGAACATRRNMARAIGLPLGTALPPIPVVGTGPAREEGQI